MCLKKKSYEEVQIISGAHSQVSKLAAGAARPAGQRATHELDTLSGGRYHGLPSQCSYGVLRGGVLRYDGASRHWECGGAANDHTDRA